MTATVTGAPTIQAGVESDPLVVRLEQTNVPRAVWYEVQLILHGSEPGSDGSLRVQPVALLEGRRRLLELLVEAGVALTVSDELRRILERAGGDDRAFGQALTSAEIAADRIDLSAALADGSFAVIRTLTERQQSDLAKLATLAHGANFSVPGAGKTTVAYVLHALSRISVGVDKLLVVAPLSAFGAWEEDASAVLDPAPRVRRMVDENVPNADVVLINYQRLPQSLKALSGWALRHRVHVVVDEAHRMKRGVAGEWGSALMALAPLAVRRDILTGTPAPNHPRDFVALLDFLWPSKRASGRLPRAALRTDPPLSAVRTVGEAISPFFVRTNKAQLDLPAVSTHYLPVEMGDLQRGIYEALRSRYQGHLGLNAQDQAAFARMGEVTMYLLQAASSPRLLRSSADPARAYRFPPLAIPAGSRLATLVEEYADHEVPAKIAAACRIVAENAAADRKTLVWSNFPENLLDLELQLASLQPAVVYGGVPSMDDAVAPAGVRTRERELDRFRNDDDCKVLLANPAALSEGVSLHHQCHDAIYIDRTFNAGQYLQSLDRIHRLGLERDTITNVTILTSPGTIDDSVNHRLSVKTERLAAMLADEHLVQMALPDDEDGVLFLDDSEDLAALLAHLAG